MLELTIYLSYNIAVLMLSNVKLKEPEVYQVGAMNRNNIIVKLISIMIIITFLSNATLVSSLEVSSIVQNQKVDTLSAQSIFNQFKLSPHTDMVFKELFEEGIKVSSMLEFDLISGVRLLLAGHNYRDVNGMIKTTGHDLINFLPEVDRSLKEGPKVTAKFKVKGREDLTFKIDYRDTKSNNIQILKQKENSVLKDFLIRHKGEKIFSTRYDPGVKYSLMVREDFTVPDLIRGKNEEPIYMFTVNRMAEGVSPEFPVAAITGIAPYEGNGFQIQWVFILDYIGILDIVEQFRKNHKKADWSLKEAMANYIEMGPDIEYKTQMKILYPFLFTELNIKTDEKVYGFFSDIGNVFAREEKNKNKTDEIVQVKIDMKRRGIAKAATEYLTSFAPIGSRLRFRVVEEYTNWDLDKGKKFQDTLVGTWFEGLGYEFIGMQKETNTAYPIVVLEKKNLPEAQTIWQDPGVLGVQHFFIESMKSEDDSKLSVKIEETNIEEDASGVKVHLQGTKIITVLEAGVDPYIYIGFKDGLDTLETRNQFYLDLIDPNCNIKKKYLNKILVKKGDVFRIASGTIFLGTEGFKYLSINSGIKTESFHRNLEGVIYGKSGEKDYRLVPKDISGKGNIWRFGVTDSFAIERFEINKDNEFEQALEETSHNLTCIEGEVEVVINNRKPLILTKDMTIDVPVSSRSYKIKAIDNSKVLKVWVPEDPENRKMVDGLDLVGFIETLNKKGLYPKLAGKDLSEFKTNFRLMDFLEDHCIIKNPLHIANVLRRGVKNSEDKVYRAIFGEKRPHTDESNSDKPIEVVMLRGGRGGSQFTQALINMPNVKVTTIVAGTDDGRSWYDAAQEFDATGVPDARKCISDYLDVHAPLLKVLNESRFVSVKKEDSKLDKIVASKEELIGELKKILTSLSIPNAKLEFIEYSGTYEIWKNIRDARKNYPEVKRQEYPELKRDEYPEVKWQEFTSALTRIYEELLKRKDDDNYKFNLGQVPIGSLLFLGIKLLLLDERKGTEQEGYVEPQEIINRVMEIYGIDKTKFNVVTATLQQVHLMGMLKDGTIFLTETGVNEYTRTAPFHELVYVKKDLVAELLSASEIAGCKVGRLEEYDPEKNPKGDKEIYETVRRLEKSSDKNIRAIASFLREKSIKSGFEANPAAVKAIKNADISILVPTTNFSNMNPSLTLKDISGASQKSSAFKTWFMNMAKDDCDERGQLFASYILEGIVRSAKHSLPYYGQIEWWKNSEKIIKYMIGQPRQYERLAENMPDPRDEREYLLMNSANFQGQGIVPVGLRMEKTEGTNTKRKDYSDGVLYGLYDPDLMVDALFSLYNLEMNGYEVDLDGNLVFRAPVPSRVMSEYMNEDHKAVIILKREEASGNAIMARCRDAIRQYKADIKAGIWLEGEVQCNIDALRRDIIVIERKRADALFSECQKIISKSLFTEDQRRDLKYLMREIYEDHYIPHASKSQAREANGIHHGVQILYNLLKIGIGEKVTYDDIKKLVVLPFMHDIAYQYLDKISTPSDLISSEAEARSSIGAKKEQAKIASKMAREKLIEMEILGSVYTFNEDEINNMCLIIESYCTPTIKKIMNKYPDIKDDSKQEPKKVPASVGKIAQYLREAGRLWMILEDGIQQEISRAADQGIIMTHEQRIIEVAANYRKEWALSEDKKNLKGETLFRSDTAYELYLEHKRKIVKEKEESIVVKVDGDDRDVFDSGWDKPAPVKSITYGNVFQKGDEITITKVENSTREVEKAVAFVEEKTVEEYLLQLSDEKEELLPLMIKTSRYLKGKPVNMYIDLSVVSYEGLTKDQKREQQDKNLGTLAIMMAWHNSYGIDARYMIENDLDGEALCILKDKIAALAGIDGINADKIAASINHPYKTAEQIDIRLENIFSVKQKKDINDREYIIALKDNNAPGIVIPNYVAASVLGLSLAALRFMNESTLSNPDKQNDYEDLRLKTLDKFTAIYLNLNIIQDKDDFTVTQLELMVSGSSEARLYYSLEYALPFAVKLLIEDINRCHDKIQEILYAA